MDTNQTLGIAAASQNFIDAATNWMIKYFATTFAGIFSTTNTPTAEIDELYIEMRCAEAILTWEIKKSGEPALMHPGAMFDDETVEEMLRGTWG